MQSDLPEGWYRDIPIVWFTGAVLSQVGVLFLLFVGSAWIGANASKVLAILVSFYILYRAWCRGIGSSSLGWRIATVAVLLVQLAMVLVGVDYAGFH